MQVASESLTLGGSTYSLVLKPLLRDLTLPSRILSANPNTSTNMHTQATKTYARAFRGLVHAHQVILFVRHLPLLAQSQT